jgi:hypothetical protein
MYLNIERSRRSPDTTSGVNRSQYLISNNAIWYMRHIAKAKIALHARVAREKGGSEAVPRIATRIRQRTILLPALVSSPYGTVQTL